MSLTLKEAITATQTTVDVNGTDALSNGDLYAIEDEQVYIVGAKTGDIQPGQTAWQRLNVQRGQLGTTEVAHAAGVALVIVETPLGAGGGAITVDNTVDPPAEVTTLIASGAVIAGDEATLASTFQIENAETGHIVYDGLEPPSESTNLLSLLAAGLAVWEVATDGDADWNLDSNTGASIRWWSAQDGVQAATLMLLSTSLFSVGSASATVEVDFSGRIDLLAGVLNIRGATAAPANAALFTSSFALWLDATPGATKLMIKAKDSGGTVRTGEIPLA